MFTDQEVQKFLTLTLEEARKALAENNYPIASIFVDQDKNIRAITRNQCTTNSDVCAHAEILGIRELGSAVDKDNSDTFTLFTSLEPCYGCSFFIARTNIVTVYSALKDPHKGGLSELKAMTQFSDFFKNIEITNDAFPELKNDSKQLLKEYFINIGNSKASQHYE